MTKNDLYDKFMRMCATASLSPVAESLSRAEKLKVTTSAAVGGGYIVTTELDGEYLPFPAADWAGMVQAVNRAVKQFVTGFMRGERLPGTNALSLALAAAEYYGIEWSKAPANRLLLVWADEIMREGTAVRVDRLMLV